VNRFLSLGAVPGASRWSIVVVLIVLATGCAGGPSAEESPPPRLGAEIVQLRRDEVLNRVEIGVTNRSGKPVTIETIELRVPGYSGGCVQRKGEPLPAGQRVNLPTPYGEVSCDDDFHPQVGRPRVGMLVTTAGNTTPQRVVVRPADPRGLISRIAEDTCLTRRLNSEVRLSFGPHWRREGAGADTVLHGTLEVRLTTDEPRDVTQMAGSVIFDLVPELLNRPFGVPIGRVTPDHPSDSIPVLVRRSRCDGHARGETKKPYVFLVWVGPPGTDGLAMSPEISAADQDAFHAVCPL
jgi:hypothetical protein